jgi:hypothetical protein
MKGPKRKEISINIIQNLFVCLFVLEQCNVARWFPHRRHVHPQECGGKLMMVHTCGFDHG